MVTFQELRITPDGQNLIIDVSVIRNPSYYQDVYLDTIQIDTQDTFIESGPSSKTVYNTIIKGVEGKSLKSIRLTLDAGDLLPSLNSNLFFVYVKVKGTPSADTPCGMDNITTLGVVFNFYPLYQHAFNYIKELSNTCSIPKNFINYILQYKAFEFAIKTGHYTEAIKYWKKFFMKIKNSAITSNCGCYGQST